MNTNSLEFIHNLDVRSLTELDLTYEQAVFYDRQAAMRIYQDEKAARTSAVIAEQFREPALSANGTNHA